MDAGCGATRTKYAESATASCIMISDSENAVQVAVLIGENLLDPDSWALSDWRSTVINSTDRPAEFQKSAATLRIQTPKEMSNALRISASTIPPPDIMITYGWSMRAY